MKRVTKADLADTLVASHSLMNRVAAELVDCFFTTIKATLERGEEVKLSGFGVFSVRDKYERTGRDPVRSTALTIAARRVVRFQASDVLKEQLNPERRLARLAKKVGILDE